jgi:hypothetical protein
MQILPARAPSSLISILFFPQHLAPSDITDIKFCLYLPTRIPWEQVFCPGHPLRQPQCGLVDICEINECLRLKSTGSQERWKKTT